MAGELTALGKSAACGMAEYDSDGSGGASSDGIRQARVKMEVGEHHRMVLDRQW